MSINIAVTLIAPLTAEQREHAFRTFLQWTAAERKIENLQILFQAITHMITYNLYSARYQSPKLPASSTFIRKTGDFLTITSISSYIGSFASKSFSVMA